MSTDYDEIMRRSHITFINEIMRQTKTHDSTNDYYPNRLWLDTDTGTFGDAATLVVIDTTDWTQEDCDIWETFTDRERNDYGIAIKHYDGRHPNQTFPTSPTQWTQNYCDGWETMTDQERNSYSKGYQCGWEKKTND